MQQLSLRNSSLEVLTFFEIVFNSMQRFLAVSKPFQKLFAIKTFFWKLLQRPLEMFGIFSVVFRAIWHLENNSSGFWEFQNIFEKLQRFLVISVVQQHLWHFQTDSRSFIKFQKIPGSFQALVKVSGNFIKVLNSIQRIVALTNRFKKFHKILENLQKPLTICGNFSIASRVI